jgi:hypothetical protein
MRYTSTAPKVGSYDDYDWALVLAVLFGLATAIHHGRWDPSAFAVLMVALALLGWRFFVALRRRKALEAPRDAVALGRGRAKVVLVFALLVVMAIVSLLDRTVLPEAAMARWSLGRAAQVLSWALAITYAPFLSGRREPEVLKTLRFGGFAALLCVAGLSVIHASATPDIDVWTIQQRGAEVLLEGKNPYVWATVPDTDPETDFTVPYVYPPMALYVGVIGRLVGGDVRYALLGTLLATGLALRYIARRRDRSHANATPSLVEDAPALFLWQAPPLFMVLDRSWIDPVQILLVTLGVAAHVAGRPTLVAVMLGVAASSKQSMFWVVPLALVLLRFDLRRWIVMAVAAALPLVPFVVWDFRRLKYALFDFMSTLPPRSDGLCFTSWMKRAFGVAFPTQLGFVFAAAIVVAACLRARPANGHDGAGMRGSPSDFGRAVLLTYFAFFFFNRWAFANYYFLLTGFSTLAAAAALSDTHSGSARDRDRA